MGDLILLAAFVGLPALAVFIGWRVMAGAMAAQPGARGVSREGEPAPTFESATQPDDWLRLQAAAASAVDATGNVASTPDRQADGPAAGFATGAGAGVTFDAGSGSSDSGASSSDSGGGSNNND